MSLLHARGLGKFAMSFLISDNNLLYRTAFALHVPKVLLENGSYVYVCTLFYIYKYAHPHQHIIVCPALLDAE